MDKINTYLAYINTKCIYFQLNDSIKAKQGCLTISPLMYVQFLKRVGTAVGYTASFYYSLCFVLVLLFTVYLIYFGSSS